MLVADPPVPSGLPVTFVPPEATGLPDLDSLPHASRPEVSKPAMNPDRAILGCMGTSSGSTSRLPAPLISVATRALG